MDPGKFPPIRVFVKTPNMDDMGPLNDGDPKNLINGRIYTIDNRRLYAFRQAGMPDIPTEWASPRDIERLRWHFTTGNGGFAILLLLLME